MPGRKPGIFVPDTFAYEKPLFSVNFERKKMKKLIAVIGILSLLSYGACKKASGPADANSIQPDNNRDSLVKIDATINGVDWTTKSVFGYSVKSVTDSGHTNLLISASQTIHDTVSTLSFTISNYSGPGTFLIDPPVYAATYYRGRERHYATSGQIIVTADSNYAITGTFNFIADSINVTNGTFNIAKP